MCVYIYGCKCQLSPKVLDLPGAGMKAAVSLWMWAPRNKVGSSMTTIRDLNSWVGILKIYFYYLFTCVHLCGSSEYM